MKTYSNCEKASLLPRRALLLNWTSACIDCKVVGKLFQKKKKTKHGAPMSFVFFPLGTEELP